MKQRASGCIEIETDLVASAIGEADSLAAGRVAEHVSRCEPCRLEHSSYRAIDRELGTIRESTVDVQGVARSRERLESRLLDLKSRIVEYRVFDSPLGPVLLAHSEQGVVLLEYLHGRRDLGGSRLARMRGIEAVEDGGDAERLYREFQAFVEGRAHRLEWPLDLRLAKGPFQRRVLERTTSIPYGAVVSYKRVASDLGQPRAVRAVAQALRWNPVPVAIPCHRVVGATGLLTGYAGGATDRKRRLLSTEGVPVVPAHDDFAVARGAMYLLAPGDSEYCIPSCPSTETLQSGLLTYFGSRNRAEAVGLRPCTTCRPDLHPIHEVN
ncbi:MAG TPA: methylated-DNA--[protein]-cysteine S-methyltransferase [Methylomirabilota bacterium]|nr:methylated-DNA--[protein]-cysteine S-methyltransferase [Methylomirabilota bacterium]